MDELGYTPGVFEKNGAPTKRFQLAFGRLHPTRTVCGQHAKPLFPPSTPQNRLNTGAQKAPHRPPRFVRKLPGYTPFSAKIYGVHIELPPHFVQGILLFAKQWLPNSTTPF